MARRLTVEALPVATIRSAAGRRAWLRRLDLSAGHRLDSDADTVGSALTTASTSAGLALRSRRRRARRCRDSTWAVTGSVSSSPGTYPVTGPCRQRREHGHDSFTIVVEGALTVSADHKSRLFGASNRR
jgi:hypothetical protein